MRGKGTLNIYFLAILTFFITTLLGCGGNSEQSTNDSITPQMREFSQIEEIILKSKIEELVKHIPDGYNPLKDGYIFLLDEALNTYVTMVPVEPESKNDANDKYRIKGILELAEIFNKDETDRNLKQGIYLLSYREIEGEPIVELLDTQTLEPLYKASDITKGQDNSYKSTDGSYFDIGLDCSYKSEKRECFLKLSFLYGNDHIKASFNIGNSGYRNIEKKNVVAPDGTVVDIILLIKKYMEEDSKLFDLPDFNPDKISILLAPDTTVALAPTPDGAFGYIKVGYKNTNNAIAVRLITEKDRIKIVNSLGEELLSDKIDHDVQTYGGTKRVGIYYDPFSKYSVDIHCECENARVAPGGCIRRPLPRPWPDPFPEDDLIKLDFMLEL